jgi:hypothetical protein
LPIWDLLLPVLLGLILLDVAVRRIAWDWASIQKLLAAVGGRVHALTETSKVETRQSVDALKRIREEGATKDSDAAKQPVTGTAVRPPAIVSAPDPKAKFEAKGVEGDIGSLVGGATDKPLPAAPKKIEPKGLSGGPVDSMGGLMAAKRRAQQQIKEKSE